MKDPRRISGSCLSYSQLVKEGVALITSTDRGYKVSSFRYGLMSVQYSLQVSSPLLP